MSGREWKPGDVAMVTDVTGDVRPMIHVGHDPANRCWHGVENNGDLRCLASGQEQDARLLVVIDPDEIPVARGSLAPQWLRHLAADLKRDTSTFSTSLENVLAFLADRIEEAGKPPTPEEPTGLGAVVEDADGTKWILVYDHSMWQRHDNRAEWKYFSEIDVVRVLSEGVTA